MAPTSIRGRPSKHSRQIYPPESWIGSLISVGSARDEFVAGVRTLIVDWTPRANSIAGRNPRLKRLWKLHKKNLEFSQDSRTRRSRREMIQAEAARLQPYYKAELPIESILPLMTFQGADYLFRYLYQGRKDELGFSHIISTRRLNESVTAIARAIIFQYCKAQMKKTDYLGVNVIKALPNTFRRGTRPTAAPSVSLAGLLGSVLAQLELSGNVCAALSQVVRGWKKSANYGVE